MGWQRSLITQNRTPNKLRELKIECEAKVTGRNLEICE